MLLPLLIAAVAGYLLGALPFGYLVARSKGVNIFEVGSKNPGATNVRRVLGPGPGNLVFALDALKGALATLVPLAYFWLRRESGAAVMVDGTGHAVYAFDWRTASAVLGLIAALVGHGYSCFTGFRGGKGVATSAGGLLVLMPLAGLMAALAWVIVFYSTRYVSLASIAAALALATAAILLSLPRLLMALALVIAAFVIVRHRSNIVRLMNGTENRCGKKEMEPKA